MTATRRTTRAGARLAATRLAAMCLGIVLVAGGCGGDGPRSVQVPELVDHDRDSTAGIAELDPARTDVLSAADLRLTVEQILGEHTWLAVDSSLTAAEGAPELDAVLAAITANTTSLTGAIGIVYGPAGARAVDELWVMHTQFFLDWAVARASDDEAGMARAERRLDDYEADFASLLATATEGRIPADAAQSLLAVHVAQVLDVLDAHLDGDDAREQTAVHEAYSYARTVGGALAAGFAAQQPEAFPGEIDDPATEARSALAAELGEWALLCADLGASPDQQADDDLAASRDARTAALVELLDEGSPTDWQTIDAALAEHAAAVSSGVADERAAADAGLVEASATLAVDFAAAASEARSAPRVTATGTVTTSWEVEAETFAPLVDDLVAALAGVADATATGDTAGALGHRSSAYAAAYALAAALATPPTPSD
jgi:hypothetical protein